MDEARASQSRRPRLGQLVTSRAGRDTGHAYLVVGVRPDGWVLVADGEHRPQARAKAKNPRHLWLHDRVAEGVSARLANQQAVTDGELAAALKALLAELNGAG
ncbi:MAG: KOW domain-containing RNA-binding protein [Limnochordaceae bacterium]|nr:KOW domain-containing RNA-binding protein [Limnochordaceae bacterium]